MKILLLVLSVLLQTPQDNVISAKPDEHCVTFQYNELNSDNDDRWLFIEDDLNNDGKKECFFIAKREIGYGLIIVASDSQQRFNNQYKIQVKKEAVDSCTISVVFHDFDNDGTKEIIIGYTDIGMLVKGNVFRWKEPTNDEPRCLINTGEFTFHSFPIVDGNQLSSSNPTDSKVNTYIYSNQKLEKAK